MENDASKHACAGGCDEPWEGRSVQRRAADAYKRNPECGHSAHAHHEHHRERRHARILPMATREERSVRIGSAKRRTGCKQTRRPSLCLRASTACLGGGGYVPAQ